MISVYLARSLWPLVSRYADARRCVKCDAPADYVQAIVSAGNAERPVKGHFRRASAYCTAHIGPVAARRTIPCVDSQAELVALVCAERQALEANYARQRAEHAAREAAVLAEFGRILRLSGSRGRMYELADGSLECEFADGRRERPCCWREGGRLIDSRAGGRLAVGHNEECPERSRAGPENR